VNVGQGRRIIHRGHSVEKSLCMSFGDDVGHRTENLAKQFVDHVELRLTGLMLELRGLLWGVWAQAS